MTWLRNLIALPAALAIACVAMAQEPAPSAPANAGSGRPRAPKTECPPLEYPAASTRAEESGTTDVRVSVDSSGELIGSSVARSSGHARLDSAAMHAIARCKFTPARNAAGVAVAGTALIKFDWRLEEPVMPDPWPVLRRANVAAFSATADLATIPFSTPTRANAEQRVKILAAMQKESAIQTGCTSIETISAAPVPLEHTYDLPFDPKTGKPLRFLREFWTATQCDKTMTYMLRMRLSETEGVSYTMWPLPDRSAPPVR